jgi:hypothetical protein
MDAFRDFLNRVADIEAHMFEPLNANAMVRRNEVFAQLEQLIAPPALGPNIQYIDRLREMEELALEYRNERNNRAVGIPDRVDLLEQVRRHLENRIRQIQGLPPIHNNEIDQVQALQMNVNVDAENINMHMNNQNENMRGGRRKRRAMRKTRKARKMRKSRKSYRRRN